MLPPRAYVFIGLNIVRFLSIIALILVFASNIVTLAHDIQAVNKFMEAGGSVSSSSSSSNSTLVEDYIPDSTVPNQAAGVFWAVVNRLLILFQVVVLFLSEVGWPSAFFSKFFPVLGHDFGLGALGVIQCLIGAAVLSHRIDDFTLVSAFFLFSIGCLNILLGLVFRQGAKIKRSPTAWKDHAKSVGKSVLPTHVGPVPVGGMAEKAFDKGFDKVFGEKDSRGSTHTDGDETLVSGKSGFGFGRQGEKKAALQGYLISKPVESLPRYAPQTSPAKI